MSVFFWQKPKAEKKDEFKDPKITFQQYANLVAVTIQLNERFSGLGQVIITERLAFAMAYEFSMEKLGTEKIEVISDKKVYHPTSEFDWTFSFTCHRLESKDRKEKE